MNTSIYFFCCVCQSYRNKEYFLTYLGYKGGWLSCCKKCNDELKKSGDLDENFRLIKYVPLYRIEQINDDGGDGGDSNGNWHSRGCESCGYEDSDEDIEVNPDRPPQTALSIKSAEIHLRK